MTRQPATQLTLQGAVHAHESALQELCDLRRNPVTADERKLRADWEDELEFERFIVGQRRIRHFTELLASSG